MIEDPMSTADLRAAITRVFGPLHDNTHTYYSEIAGDVLWTEKFSTPGGHTYMLMFNIADGEADAPKGEPACFMVDFWWFPPLMKGTMMGHKIPPFDPKGIGVYTTVEDVNLMKVLVDTVMVPQIDEEHLRMSARFYWTEMLKPSLEASGVPEDGLRHMREHYVKGALENPEAMRQILDWFKEKNP
jgi:hypothetical protein